MGKNSPTDVLSFPSEFSMRGARKYLGEILISLDTASYQAHKLSTSLEKEVVFLILHSILHLLGYDHALNKERARMMATESFVWENLWKI